MDTPGVNEILDIVSSFNDDELNRINSDTGLSLYIAKTCLKHLTEKILDLQRINTSTDINGGIQTNGSLNINVHRTNDKRKSFESP